MSTPTIWHVVVTKQAQRYINEGPSTELVYREKTTLMIFYCAGFARSDISINGPTTGSVVILSNTRVLYRSKVQKTTNNAGTNAVLVAVCDGIGATLNVCIPRRVT